MTTALSPNIVHQGMWIRAVLTIGIIPWMNHLAQWTTIDYRILLYFALLILDFVDSILPKILYGVSVGLSWDYQFWDKIVDTLSYWYTLICYGDQLDVSFRYALYYRTIGALIFIMTRQSVWLILFFDAVKEMLIYRYLFGAENTYLFGVFIFVVAFEIIHKNLISRKTNGTLSIF